MGLEELTAEELDLAGTRFTVYRRGEGRPFYWGHGVTSSTAQEARAGLMLWQELREGFEVVCVDARGHGESEPDPDPAAYRWPRLADDLLAVADRLGHPRIIAGGASMGAATALHSAVTAPDRVEGLVLMIPPTAWETRAAQAGRYRGDADLVEREGHEALIAVEAERPQIPIFAGLIDPVAMARARYEALDASVIPAIFRGAADSDLPHPDVVAKLRQPTLLLAWEGDEGHPVSTAEALLELLPQAELHVASQLADLGAWPGLVKDFCTAL